VFWCAYGIAVFDMFIAVPNGLGALLGVIQMFLCLVFPRRIAATTGSARDDDNNDDGMEAVVEQGDPKRATPDNEEGTEVERRRENA
jgi:solute carrier family 50 protein (sugar transporter)